MSPLLDLELIAGLALVLIAAVVALVIVQGRIARRNAVARREHLKDKARRL